MSSIIKNQSGKLSKKEFGTLVAEYQLPKISAVKLLSEGSRSSEYLLETIKGKYTVRFDTAKSEMELKREIDLLHFLRKHGFPCYAPLPDRRGRYSTEADGAAITVCRYIDGRTLTPERVSPAQLENVGRVLADLHLVGKAYKKGVDNRFGFERVSEVYQDARSRLPPYFKKIIRTFDEELDYLRHYLEGKLPKGIIHGDLFPERIRFKGDKVVTILDFECAARGKFIFDLANAVNFLCVEEGRYSLKRFEALIAGYEGLRTLSLAEWDAFPNELRFSAFRFTATRLRDFFLATGEERESLNRDFQDFYERMRILRREKEGGMEPMLMAMATGYDYRKYQRVKAFEKRGGR